MSNLDFCSEKSIEIPLKIHFSKACSLYNLKIVYFLTCILEIGALAMFPLR